MNKFFVYSTDGLGAVAHVSDDNVVRQIGLFGQDATGNDLVLAGFRGPDGTFHLTRRSRGASTSFPNIDDNLEVASFGYCTAVLADYNNQLHLSFSIDLAAYGVDMRVDFSPPLGSQQTGSLTLFRL